MKLVREHINEKFTEDSDPIHDMGIGMDALFKRWIENETTYLYKKRDLLWICAQYGKTEFVKYLIEKRHDVHVGKDYALRLASENGYIEIVKLLLEAGADVHADNDWPLHLASSHGYTEVVKLLLNAGADVHAYKDYALRYASEYGHTEVVKVLLDAGANVHADNNAPLQWASENGHAEVVKVLKDWIAKEKKEVNEKFTEDSDPIHDMGIGIGNIFPEICKSILEEDKNKIFFTIHFIHSDIIYFDKSNKYIIIHLNIPKLHDQTEFHTNEALKNYIEKIFKIKNYDNIFTEIHIQGKFLYYFIDVDTDEKILSRSPQIYCKINPTIKIKDNYIEIQRDHRDLNVLKVNTK